MSWGLTAALVLGTASGCRTPWRATSEQPDFDRLIEIERQQTGQRAPQRDSLSARHRPGSATRANSTANHDAADDEETDDYLERDASQLAASKTERDATHRSLSDNGDMEELLVEVPAAQRDLLRREMTAMRARGALGVDAAAGDAAAGTSDKLAQSKTPLPPAARASRRITDDSHEPLDDSSDYAGNSKYQLAAGEAQSQSREVPPRAVEQPYTRSLSDSPQPRPQSSRNSQPLVDSAPRSPVANPVVSASYSQPQSPDLSPKPEPNPATTSELTWREHIYQALEQLEKEADAASPEEQTHRAMVDRLLHLSVGDINSASEPIAGLQTHGQDFIRHSLESLYEVTNPVGNPVEIKRYSLAMLSQRKALNHLASVSNLEVHNATFCTEVDGFGVVTKFPQYNFKADQELLLYCELDNFVSTPIDGKGFETQLQGSYEVVDSSGRRVADQLLPIDSHLCRNQRRDYFIAYRIYMPQNIEPGKYQLKLTIEDLKGRKFGQSSLDFQIGM